MLEGKIVLITGSSSGIGLATAQAAHEAGATVVLHGLSRDECAAASALLGGAAFITADLAEPQAADRLAEAAWMTHGRLDGLVNNAAIFPRTDLAAADAAAFDRIFAINTRAPMLLARAVILKMQAAAIRAAIVNVGSVNAHAGQPDLLVYSMSKGALTTMTRNMADACAESGIRVNQVNPGWTLTETEIATQRALGRPDDWPALVPRVFAPNGRILLPEEIARHVLFWLSDASAPVTGQVTDAEQYPFVGRNLLSRMV